MSRHLIVCDLWHPTAVRISEDQKLMEADETKKQGIMTCVDSALQVCTQVQSHEADITGIQCNYTK